MNKFFKLKFMKEIGLLRTVKQIIRRIKIKQKKIDQDIVIKMFEKLKGKVHAANENALNSLLKI